MSENEELFLARLKEWRAAEAKREPVKELRRPLQVCFTELPTEIQEELEDSFNTDEQGIVQEEHP